MIEIDRPSKLIIRSRECPRRLRSKVHVTSESPCFSVVLNPAFLDLSRTSGLLGLFDLLFSRLGLPTLELLLPVLGDLLREFAVHSNLRALSVEVVDRAGHENGDDGEDRGSPFFGVFLADVGVH